MLETESITHQLCLCFYHYANIRITFTNELNKMGNKNQILKVLAVRSSQVQQLKNQKNINSFDKLYLEIWKIWSFTLIVKNLFSFFWFCISVSSTELTNLDASGTCYFILKSVFYVPQWIFTFNKWLLLCCFVLSPYILLFSLTFVYICL